MNAQEVIKKKLSKPKEAINYRYRASGFLFVFSFAIFLMSFYFVGVKFYANTFRLVLPYAYIFMLLSIFVYVFFLFQAKFYAKIHRALYWGYAAISFILFFILLLPILFGRGIIEFQELLQSLFS